MNRKTNDFTLKFKRNKTMVMILLITSLFYDRIQLSLSIYHVVRGRSFMFEVHEDIKCTINTKIY